MGRKITGGLKEQYKAAFEKIRADISTQDRIDAVKEVCITDNTLRRILSGHISPAIDTSEKLLDFFTKRINERKAKLSETLN